MSVTILEALQNAELNLENAGRLGGFAIELSRRQLHNAVVLLEKGYSVHAAVEPLLEQFGTVEGVPERYEEGRMPA